MEPVVASKTLLNSWRSRRANGREWLGQLKSSVVDEQARNSIRSSGER